MCDSVRRLLFYLWHILIVLKEFYHFKIMHRLGIEPDLGCATPQFKGRGTVVQVTESKRLEVFIKFNRPAQSSGGCLLDAALKYHHSLDLSGKGNARMNFYKKTRLYR